MILKKIMRGSTTFLFEGCFKEMWRAKTANHGKKEILSCLNIKDFSFFKRY